MARLQELHPDQQAVLQLVLRRGMAYASIAEVLGLPAPQVRERALDAIDGLAPDDIDGLALEDRDRIADHLLRQESPEQRQETERWLAGHEPARAWAALVDAELAPLRPEAPAAGSPPPSSLASAPSGAATPAPAEPTVPGTPHPSPDVAGSGPALASATDAAPGDVRQAFAALDADDRGRRPLIAGDRPAWKVVLPAVGGLLVLIAVVLFVTGAFDNGSDDPDGAKAAAPPTTTTTSDDAAATAIVAALPKQINFLPPKGAVAPYAKAAGVGQPNAVQGVPGILFVGAGFPAMTKTRLYAVWIDGGGKKPVRLGWFSDGSGSTSKTIDSNGKIKQAFFPLATAGSSTQAAAVVNPVGYTRIRITRETGDRATPGPTVVSGSLQQ